MDGCMNIVSNHHSFCYDHREPDRLARAVTRAEKAVVHEVLWHLRKGHVIAQVSIHHAGKRLLAARAAASKKAKT
jgi:hypothetical protein